MSGTGFTAVDQIMIRHNHTLLAKSAASVIVLALIAGAVLFATNASAGTMLHARGANGTVSLALDDGSGDGRGLALAVDNIAPGDVIEQVAVLRNNGTLDVSPITFEGLATASSLLDTDVTHGLQLQIDVCSRPWEGSGTATAMRYTCTSGARSLVQPTPVITGPLELSGLAAQTAAGIDHLRVRVSLPTSAGNEFQGQSSQLELRVSATQRT